MNQMEKKLEEMKDEHEMLMDHVAMEAIHAVHNHDHDMFRNSFHTLVAHTLNEMSDSEPDEGE